MLFDWLITGQIVPMNPAAAVRGPKHVVKTGKTPVLDPEDWRKLIDSIPTVTVRDLRDRALIATLTYSFARTTLPAMFYEDVSAEDRYRAMERLRPQPIAISTTPVTLTEERFGSVPRWYIECLHDNAVRIARQRAMVKAMPCKVITMECGHTPFYSQPEELAEHLETIAKS